MLRAIVLAASTAFLIAAFPETSGAQACFGDCDADGTVTVDELIVGVDIALELRALDDCHSFDADGDGQVTVDELVGAVAAALKGCPGATASPTPAGTAPPTASSGATDTPTRTPICAPTGTPYHGNCPTCGSYGSCFPCATVGPNCLSVACGLCFNVTPTPTQTPAALCTPPVCDSGQVLYCSTDYCPGGCGVQCGTPTPTWTPTPTPAMTSTPTAETPTGSPTGTPAATRTPTPALTPTCAPTGTPYCASACNPCPTIRAGCYSIACGACIPYGSCPSGEVQSDCEPSLPCRCACVTPTPGGTPPPPSTTPTETLTPGPTHTFTPVPTVTGPTYTPTLTPTQSRTPTQTWTAGPTHTPGPGGFAYVTGFETVSGLDAIAVIDTATHAIAGILDSSTLSSGHGYGIAFRPDGTRAYATRAASLLVIDTASRTVSTTVPVGAVPESVAVTPDGAFAYVPNFADHTVSVIATADNTVTTTIVLPGQTRPSGIAITPDGSKAFVGSFDGWSVLVIDVSSNTVVTSVGVAPRPFSIAANPAGAFVYVAGAGTTNISAIATATNAVSSVPVGDGGTAIAVTPDGTRAYLTGGRNVYAINTTTYATVGTVPDIGSLGDVAITPDGGVAYVTDPFSYSVSVIDTATHAVSTIPLPISVRRVAIGNVP